MLTFGRHPTTTRSVVLSGLLVGLVVVAMVLTMPGAALASIVNVDADGTGSVSASSPGNTGGVNDASHGGNLAEDAGGRSPTCDGRVVVAGDLLRQLGPQCPEVTDGTTPSMSPAQAAQTVVESFQLEAIDLAMAPHINPELGHRRGFVGVPIWMWAASQTSLNWGPNTASAEAGGHWVTATARVSTVHWDMGDGTTVICAAGNPYHEEFGVVDSPACGHHYSQTSAEQPGGMYTVTATSHWTVTWSTSGGASGVISLALSTTTQVEILELQSVNV